eukprot:SAG22_NODE_226_length_14668_cov_29.647495_6_plen_182_part_00
MKVPVCADCGVQPQTVKSFLYAISAVLLAFHLLFLAGRISDKAGGGGDGDGGAGEGLANATNATGAAADPAAAEAEDTTFRIVGNAVATVGYSVGLYSVRLATTTGNVLLVYVFAGFLTVYCLYTMAFNLMMIADIENYCVEYVSSGSAAAAGWASPSQAQQASRHAQRVPLPPGVIPCVL